MWDRVRRDFGRCGGSTGARLREVAFNPGMWAVLCYRFRRWAATAPLPWPARKLAGLAAALVGLGVELATGITLPATAELGPGLYIAHVGTIVVGSATRIGANCTLTQGVTIGHGGGGNKSPRGNPTLGDRVYVGPGSILIGPITVGDDALIGAGAVVTRSVPPRGVVAGNPARLLSLRGSFDLIDYPGMEGDPARRAALGSRVDPAPGGGGAAP